MLSPAKTPSPLLRAPAMAWRPPLPALAPIVQKSASPGPVPCACGGGCPRCAGEALRTKPAVSEPSDPLEQEADRIAEQVMRKQDADLQPTARMPGMRREENTARATHLPRIVHDALSSSGAPLDTPTRAFMEPRFGANLSDVRVHTDAKAAQSAWAIGAAAYTVGTRIVFGAGQFAPTSITGQRLIAHELAHALQPQSMSPRTVMRKWDKASECADGPADKWIEKVVVSQETPQTVTAHWSDGTTESDSCSSGKGHCCVDPAEPSGVTCTVSGSRVEGSNCTPITLQSGYLVKNRVRDHKGIEFWTEFEPGRTIALHEYAPVDGTPLSHGCVRLNTDMATKIFCNVRQNQTWVQVKGFARPMCDHGALRDEWLGDFAVGGSDLSKADGDTQRQISEVRRELNAAFGRTLSVAEIQALTADDIPRCKTKAPMPKSP